MNMPFHVKILRAAEDSTRHISVNGILPTPDQHLLNLWNTRQQLHHAYLADGRRYADLLKVLDKTAQARRYAKQLARERWLDHCASFGERTGLRELWQTFRAINGERKHGNPVQAILLREGITSVEFEDLAASTFFLQPRTPPVPHIYQKRTPACDDGVESPFTLQELLHALQSVNERSAPGKDRIAWQMLRNLDHTGKQQLLDNLNHAWMSGTLPPEWKHSVVIPVPKPGKSPTQLSNMRPISLTSTICKLLERMVLTRLNYHLQEHCVHFHPAQTGFRPNLCTHDSLDLLRRLANN